MQPFVDALKAALEAQNWYAALLTALTLPDMCAAAEGLKEGNGERYRRWCNTYLVAKYTVHAPNDPVGRVFLTGDDIWKLRNAVLHEGSDQVRRDAVADVLHRVGFSSAGAHKNLIQVNGVTALNLTVPGFCHDVIAAVERWQFIVSDNAIVQENLGTRLTVHTEDYDLMPGVRIGVTGNRRPPGGHV
jgi:hypothetical protein